MANSELVVITKAKDLCDYILTVTDKSPKRFRFTLTSRLQNYSLDIIEYLILANEVYVSGGNQEYVKERLRLQRQAMARLKMMGYFANIAAQRQCILPKQFEQISKKIYDCQNLLGAWMNSDRKRNKGSNAESVQNKER